jgi:uncharacterized protein (TIGR02996 family)
MSTEAAFIEAIGADPDDDAPRLVYADWLDDHGQADRAEFIRAQVALASRENQADDESRRLKVRVAALLEAHFATWTAELGPFDRKRVEVGFDRGFPELLTVRSGTVADLRILQRLPGLRMLTLQGGQLPPRLLRIVAGLSQLDSLTIEATSITGAKLALLEALPCWTGIRIEFPGLGDATWRAFLERRVEEVLKLPPEQRRQAVVRFLRPFHIERPPLSWGEAPDRQQALRALHHLSDRRPCPNQPVKAAWLSRQGVTEPELRLLHALPEVEEVYISDATFEPGVTSEALEHLARLPHLKSVTLFNCPVDSIAPLTRCAGLEVLQVDPELHVVLDDDGTEGLDRLTNLRVLALSDGSGGNGFADATIRRLAPLRRLRSLQLPLREWDQPYAGRRPLGLDDESCLAAFAGLTELESLELYGNVTNGLLQHLAPLRRLRTLSLMISRGDGSEFRHLADLPDLRFLCLRGQGVKDNCLEHLARLPKLRTLMAQESAITERAAKRLAQQLPEVTIILDRRVVKSPRKTITFRRQAIAPFVSVLFPIHWTGGDLPQSRESIWLIEDGWEEVGSWSSTYGKEGSEIGPGRVHLELCDQSRRWSPRTALQQCMREASEPGDKAGVLEEDVVAIPGLRLVSRIFGRLAERHLACAASAGGGRTVVLDCQAPPGRFKEFRPLFGFVARSLRLGEAAAEGVGEETEVPVSRL